MILFNSRDNHYTLLPTIKITLITKDCSAVSWKHKCIHSTITKIIWSYKLWQYYEIILFTTRTSQNDTKIFYGDASAMVSKPHH